MVVCFQLAMFMTRVPGLQTSGVLLAALKEGRKFVEAFVKVICVYFVCGLVLKP